MIEDFGKFILVEDRNIHALLFAYSFESKIGFGFGLALSKKTKPELVPRKTLLRQNLLVF